MPSRLLIALLSASLSLTAAAVVQLLPAGEFAARDGRPGAGKSWTLSDAQGRQIAAALNAQSAQTRFLFDVDHQTIRAEANGQPAPAAGWATRFEWRPGQGLYALDATWTDQARGWIESGKYAYISPVITFDAAGAVTGVLMAAITNYPALLGMDAAVAQLNAQFLHTHHQPPETDMALLASLLAALGLPATTPETDAIAAVTALKARPLLPTALFAIWALIIAVLAWLMERGGGGGDASGGGGVLSSPGSVGAESLIFCGSLILVDTIWPSKWQ